MSVGAQNCVPVVVPKAIAHVAGQLTRAAVELAKLWRNDKYLRKLDVRQRTERNTGKCSENIHLGNDHHVPAGCYGSSRWKAKPDNYREW